MTCSATSEMFSGPRAAAGAAKDNSKMAPAVIAERPGRRKPVVWRNSFAPMGVVSPEGRFWRKSGPDLEAIQGHRKSIPCEAHIPLSAAYKPNQHQTNHRRPDADQ